MSTKILTIDDSKINRMIVNKTFKDYQCTIMEATNGAEGLAIAGREKPDLILLDYNMPVMDGIETLTQLRGDPDLKSIPVIMLTTIASRETVVKIARLGVRDYLIKPYKEEVLLERVGRVVSLQANSADDARAKRVDDALRILVVDDKPAIVEQIRAGLSKTPWQVSGADQPAAALDLCMKQEMDFVLVSLTLPREGAAWLLQNLRGYASTATIPVYGLCVKTAIPDAARLAETGFGGFVTKPIDCEDLKVKITRVLKLESSYKYFQELNGALVLSLPKQFQAEVAVAVSSEVNQQLTSIVDAGGDKVIVDMNAVEEPTLAIIELVLSVIRAAGELSIKHAMVGSETLSKRCRMYEETQGWKFANTIEEAAALLK
jgi:two-component system cell cycle response regulator